MVTCGVRLDLGFGGVLAYSTTISLLSTVHTLLYVLICCGAVHALAPISLDKELYIHQTPQSLNFWTGTTAPGDTQKILLWVPGFKKFPQSLRFRVFNFTFTLDQGSQWMPIVPTG